MLSAGVGAILLAERRSTAFALTASCIPEAVKALQRIGVVVRSNDCCSIPKNDLERVERTSCNQTATLLQRKLMAGFMVFQVLLSGIIEEINMRWTHSDHS